MKVLFVHPGPLLYTNVFLRLEPLGLELVAEAARRAKHTVRLLDAVAGDRGAIVKVPGAVTADGEGPRPGFVEHLDEIRPARDLVRKRRKYFIGVLDPCASIEFSRGCPWDCSFCSAWTFYGRSYRTKSPEVAVEEIARIREPGIFLLDDEIGRAHV